MIMIMSIVELAAYAAVHSSVYFRDPLYIVHPESFRSNAQNAIAFACRNRPHVNRSGEFACIYLHLRAFVCTYLCAIAHT